jgi:hypothetical protein
MSSIRVTYSGLIGLIVSLLGVATGTIFVILVTRNLLPEEFGLWTLIGSLVSYVLIINPVITYWSTRQIARGEEIGRTALATTGMFSIAGAIGYIGIAFFIALTTDADLDVLLLSSILIPLMFTTNILTSICMGFKPQAVSYALLAFEVSKIPFGFLLVAVFEFGIIGAIVATMFSSVIRIIVLAIHARGKIIGTIKLSIIKFWFKLSWLTIYLGGAGFIHKLDVLIFSILTNSFLGLAYWGVAQTASKFVGHSTYLSTGLYPKLLSGGRIEIAEQNLIRTLYFAIPLLGFSIVFAKPALHVLNPLYIEGVLIVIFISLRTFTAQIQTIFFDILSANESVDMDKQASFRQFIKSKLFFLPTLDYIYSISYVSILVVFLLFFNEENSSEIFVVTIWSGIAFVATIPFLIYGITAVRKQHNFHFTYPPIIKYAAITIIISFLITMISEEYLTYHQSIFEFVPQVIPLCALFIILYFGLTFVFDESTKKLFKAIIKEIIKRQRK